MLNVKISCEIKKDIFGKPELSAQDFFQGQSHCSEEGNFIALVATQFMSRMNNPNRIWQS